MNNIFLRLVRLFLKHGNLCLVTIVINLDGNSSYVENMTCMEKGGNA